MSGKNWFIGLPVRADELPAGVLASLPAGIHRFHAEDLHITVAFLGPIGERRARGAFEITDWTQWPTLSAMTGPRAAFGNPRRPSAYGLDVEGEAVRRFLAAWRDPLLHAAGRPAETRAVRPHVTLGRPPRRLAATMRDRARPWLDESQPSMPLRLDRIALFTGSDERPHRLFTRLRECPLTASSGNREPGGGTAR